jgi:Cu2+-exporting ATPase
MSGTVADRPLRSASAAACFHCGLPVPATGAPSLDTPHGRRVFCCVGCEAVSRFIEGAGLDGYYRLRTERAVRPDEDAPREVLALYDQPAMQERFVRREAGVLEAELVVEGMTCAACAWLLEHAIARVPGVVEARVNFAAHRARVRWREKAARASDVFAAVRDCGCRAWPFEAGRLARVDAGERRALLLRFLVAALGMMQAMMYAAPTYLAAEGELGDDAASLMRWAGLVLTTPVLLYSAAPFFRNAWHELRARRLGVDVPVCLGLSAAYAASVVATLRGAGAVYFDSVTMFVFFVTGARLVERAALERAGRSLQRLAALLPAAAHRLGAGPGAETELVAAAQLAPGDRVVVRAGESVPADGVLASPSATVSEALLSGESQPVERALGERVMGGSINAGDAFTVLVTHASGEGTLSTLRRMMETAAAARAPWVEAAQRAAGVFTAAILAAAALAGLAWCWIDPARALWVAVSVLIVTCPCALSLATPAAMAAAVGAAARRGLVVAQPRAIAGLARATDFVFDKTGTLTVGHPRLKELEPLGPLDADACRALAAAIARDSPHPLDHALREAAASQPLPWATDVRRFPGRGIDARVDGRHCRLGAWDFCAELHGGAAGPVPRWGDQHGASTVWLADASGWLAALRVEDRVRPGARAALAALAAMGARLHLLSGDEPAVAARVARELGIGHAQGGATPAAKIAFVRALQDRGAVVAMVGDGINDAPVLAAADVSIAMGGGADLAQVRADAVLASDAPEDLAAAVRLARRTRAVIRENLAWAIGYNVIVLPFAFSGHVTPLAAAIAMSASSLVVVANALRIR